MIHFHACPECYRNAECDGGCDTESDLCDDYRDFGAHVVCDGADAREAGW